MDDEIDLRLYAEVIWRARRIVAGVTLVAAALAWAVSRFAVRPVYEASTLLVVTQSPLLDREAPVLRSERDGALRVSDEPVAPVQAVSLAPAALAEIVVSDAFRALMRDRSMQGDGDDPPPSASLPVVRARVVDEASLVEVRAEAPHPAEAARWANAAASLLVEEARRLDAARMERALALLEQQIAAARQALDEARGRLQSFAREGPSVEALESQQAARTGLVSDYQRRLASIDVELASGLARLQALQRQLTGEPRVLSGGAAVDPVYARIQTEAALQEAALAALRAERESVEQALERLVGELQATSAQLMTARAEMQELAWQVEVARRNYERAVAQYQAQEAALASRLGESALTVVRQAIPPTSPTRPRVLLNAVVAGLLGLMASVFGVLVAEMWRQPAESGVTRAASTASEAVR
ncbi:MAG: hypothetical protein GX496_02875 [Firmicutes bacterium]|nr:hypothetical protein [Bacillota bacterium]